MRLAIRRNLSSVKDVQQAIWAIFYTSYQPMKNLSMDFVPLIQIRGANLKSFKNCLGDLSSQKIVYLWMLWRPCDLFFRDLANPELLKVFTWSTQNPNESVNNVIWSRVPKKTFVQLEVLSLGTYDAVSHLIWGMYQN
ncbi:uncharacterized protein TNCV_813761 [Trichonephila clavipes]|nr:uncharacterized protein TNCV_813761 [Trichonephila clavipes]